MTSTANLSRNLARATILTLAVGAFGSCARTTSSNALPEAAAPTTNQVADIAVSATDNSQVLALASPTSVGLEIADTRNYDRVTIHPDGATRDYTVERLSNPERLVIDLAGSKSALRKDFPAAASLVSKIRVGSHPDKTRIVLDLAGDEFLAHNVNRNSDGSIAVTVAREGFMEAALNTGATVAAVTPVADAQPAPERLEELTTTQVMDVQAGASAKLTGLSIQSLGEKGNAVIADMVSMGDYNLKKTAPSEYVLRIKGAALDGAAQTTVLAPAASGKIRSARPIVDGSDVLVRIFAQPGVELEAKSRGGKILVGETSSSNIEEAKAQFAPAADDKKSGEEKKAADATGKPGDKKAEVKVSDAQPVNAELDSDVSSLLTDTPKYTGRLISLDLQDTDIDNALRIIAEVSNLNIIASDKVTGKVTLRLIDVPWDQALDVILKTNGLDKVQEGNVIRIAPVEDLRSEREALKQAQAAEEELEPLTVKYIRISYAKAADLKPLVETVISERGSVSYDERSNQLIVKDIKKGVKNVAELVTKLDLRTPQVLLETEIVEARRNILRDLGNELGFKFVQSPATGNATGWNFPNSISAGGSAIPGTDTGANFPAAIGAASGSAVSILLGSADGTASLSARISALEEEGRIRVVSRPAVATTNNTKAQIKSVEKIRVKTPSGGLSVATGTGASNSGNSGVATEIIEIGITLDVTPQASPDYYVLLDINAKSSTFGSKVVEGIPSEVERAATSTVLVSSGQTFAMGGIYKITDNDSVSGVPFLKDIPVLGHLFRRSKIDNADEELIFFITPRIIEGSFDDAAMKVAS